jgi:hypothetical protein
MDKFELDVLKKWEDKIEKKLKIDVLPETTVKKILFENKKEFEEDCRLIGKKIFFCCNFIIKRVNIIYKKKFENLNSNLNNINFNAKPQNPCDNCVRDHEGCFEICKALCR